MSMNCITLAICILIGMLSAAAAADSHSRSKRFVPVLTFPRTSPTRVQMITGIGIPVALNFESVTIGYVFKAEYFLPENASNVLDILSDPFNPTPRPISDTGRRRRRSSGFDADTQQRYERYEEEAIEVESATMPNGMASYDDEYDEDAVRVGGAEDSAEDDLAEDAETVEQHSPYTLNDVKIREPNNLATARFTMYRGLESLLQKRGLPGRPCMLRSICEAANAQFSYHNGILGELAHIVLSPSTSPDEHVEHADGEYLAAEQMGRRREPCDQVFRECPVSVLDKFSGLYNTMEGLMNWMG